MCDVILEQKNQDMVNNNHVVNSELASQTRQMSLNESNKNDLFDASIFKQINTSQFKFQYDKFELNQENNYVDLGDNLILRPLQRNDLEKGYMNLLSQLTEVGQVSQECFEKRFDEMRSAQNTYYICVVEDSQNNKVISTLTLVYEQKFIRQASARGRFEDLVVDQEYRGKRLSKLLLDVVCQMSKILGCYKISLECKDHLKKHYEQFEFVLEAGQNYLCRRL
jgi:glucosamine-phosphate N-acetyltransferase